MWYNMPMNAEIIKFIQSFSNPVLDYVFQGITALGEEYFYIVAMAIVYWCVNKSFGYRMGFICLSSSLVNVGIKESLKVPRPIGEPGIRSLRIETATGYSFPSGHTQGVTSFWVTVMGKLKQKWVKALGFIIIFLVAISRVYLGVHRPIDVLAGFLMGLIWVCICGAVFNYVDKTGSSKALLMLLIPMLLGMLFFKTPEYYKMAGTLVGFYFGFIVEPKYINFSEKGTMTFQCIKILGGIAGVFGVKTLLKVLLPESIFSDFLRYFIVAVWVTIIMPIIINKINKPKS